MEVTTMFAVVGVTFIVMSACTAILRPLVRHLGAYLDALTRQKDASGGVSTPEAMRRIEGSLQAIHEELAKAREDREFLEQLYPLARTSLPTLSGTPRGDRHEQIMGE